MSLYNIMSNIPAEWVKGHDISKIIITFCQVSVIKLETVGGYTAMFTPDCTERIVCSLSANNWLHCICGMYIVGNPSTASALPWMGVHSASLEYVLIIKSHFNLWWFNLFSMWFIKRGHGWFDLYIFLPYFACIRICHAYPPSKYIFLPLLASKAERIFLFPYCFWPLEVLLENCWGEWFPLPYPMLSFLIYIH